MRVGSQIVPAVGAMTSVNGMRIGLSRSATYSKYGMVVGSLLSINQIRVGITSAQFESIVTSTAPPIYS